MATNLKLVIAIPNVDIQESFEINDLSIIGSRDPRYQQLKSKNKLLSKYLDSFRTPFNTKVFPTIIVCDERHTKVDAVQLCMFRNAISVSSAIYSRTHSILKNRSIGCEYTDIFDFYSISISSDEKDLTINNKMELGINDKIEDFIGNTNIVYPNNLHNYFDKEFLQLLLSMIGSKSRRKDKRELKNRLTRSLEAAYYAMRLPFVFLGSQADYGFLLSLWVTAFEILGNPYTENVKFGDVSDLIKKVNWQNKKLAMKSFSPIGISSNKKTTLPVQIYGRLYHTRNMYLHGNSIKKNQFEFVQKKKWGSLFYQIPSLYRCVLMSILEKSLKTDINNKPLLSEQDNCENVLLWKVPST